MNKEFVTYEQALELKELGFDEPCIAFYSSKKELYPVMQEPAKGPYFNNGNFIETIRAPLYQQAFRWFREKYNFCSCITPSSEKTTIKYEYGIFEDGYLNLREIKGGFKTYEEAELACLRKLIEIVQAGNK